MSDKCSQCEHCKHLGGRLYRCSEWEDLYLSPEAPGFVVSVADQKYVYYLSRPDGTFSAAQAIALVAYKMLQSEYAYQVHVLISNDVSVTVNMIYSSRSCSLWRNRYNPNCSGYADFEKVVVRVQNRFAEFRSDPEFHPEIPPYRSVERGKLEVEEW